MTARQNSQNSIELDKILQERYLRRLEKLRRHKLDVPVKKEDGVKFRLAVRAYKSFWGEPEGGEQYGGNKNKEKDTTSA